MRLPLFYLSVLLFCISCGSIKKHNEQIARKHNAEDLKKDVQLVYEQLQKLHPKLYQYINKERLDFKFDSLQKTIIEPLTSWQFYLKLSPVISEVKQGHLSISPPQKRYKGKEFRLMKKRKWGFSKLNFEYLEGKLWLKKVKGKDSLLSNSEVVKFDAVPTSKLIRDYKKLITSDGFNTTFYNRIAAIGAKSLYFKKTGFKDSIQLTLKKNDSVFTKMYRRLSVKELNKKDSIPKKNKDSIKKSIPLTKAEKKQKKLVAKEKKKFKKIHGYSASNDYYFRNFKFLDSLNTIAYMKIRGFHNGNFRKFYKQSFKAIDSLKTKNLIIDLRDNLGGRISEITYLYAHLTDKNYQFMNEGEVNNRLPFFKFFLSKGATWGEKLFTVIFSPVIATHNLLKVRKRDGKYYYKFAQSKIKKPREPSFKGNIYVLINGSSFSASSILSAQLHANKRAVFVGEETGGAYNGTVAGAFKNYELPTSKINANIGLFQIETPFKVTPDGYGVKPDFEILPTVEDRKNNKDPELDWILTAIKNKQLKD